MPERPVDDEALDELPVLDVDRPVGAERVRDPLDVLRRARLTAGLLRRVRRDDEEEDVADDRDREEQDDGPEDPADEVPDHQLTPGLAGRKL